MILTSHPSLSFKLLKYTAFAFNAVFVTLDLLIGMFGRNIFVLAKK